MWRWCKGDWVLGVYGGVGASRHVGGVCCCRRCGGGCKVGGRALEGQGRQVLGAVLDGLEGVGVCKDGQGSVGGGGGRSS